MGLFIDITSLTLKISWHSSKFVVKNIPKAIVTLASIKMQLANAIDEGLIDFQKEQKEKLLDMQIEMKIQELKEKKKKNQQFSKTIKRLMENKDIHNFTK